MSYYQKSMDGALVALLSQALLGVIQVASTAIVARILQPRDFGLVAMAATVAGFIGVFRVLGVPLAVMQSKNMDANQFNSLVLFNIVFGLFIAALMYLMSDYVSLIFMEDDLPSIFRLYSFEIFFSGLSAIYGAALLRELKFKQSAISKVFSSLVGVSTVILLSIYGVGPWSLVYGLIATSLTQIVICYVYVDWKFRIPCRPYLIIDTLKFGVNTSMANMFSFTSRNMDDFLIGRCFGQKVLGEYTKAYQLMMLPLSQIRMPITNIVYPVLSKMDCNSIEYKNYFYGAIKLLAVLTMPLMAFCYVSADEIVQVFLGDQWTGSASIFKALTVASFIQPVSSMRGIVLLSSGQPSKAMYLSFVSMVLTVMSFLLGLKWGVLGVCWAYALFSWAEFLPMYTLSLRKTSIKVSGVISNVIAIMALSVSLVLTIEYGLRLDWLSNVNLILFKLSIFIIVFTLFALSSRRWRKDLYDFVNIVLLKREI